MRIGELLNVKLSDISFSERKILIYLGEKNYQGRAVYYSKDAELALQQWIKRKKKDSVYLFPGIAGRRNLCYVAAWKVMREILIQYHDGVSGTNDLKRLVCYPAGTTLEDGRIAFVAWAEPNMNDKNVMSELPVKGLVRGLAATYPCEK